MTPVRDPRRWLASAVGVLATACAPLAWSHGGGNDDVVVTMDAVPAALGKIRVELRKTLAPQLVMENTTGTPLDIIGTDGVAFLRLGPAGAQANVNASDWYRFYATSGTPLPERLARLPKGKTLPENWQSVSSSPAWGWFDARLDTESVTVPHKARDSTGPTAFKTWRIPVRSAGRAQFLTGHFQTMPMPRGVAEARLTSSSEIAPGVSLQVLQGPVPAFMLESASAEAVVILDSEGLPLLEVGPTGVRVNTRSSGWVSTGLAESSYVPAPIAAGDGPLWQVRSQTPRFTWMDPRAALPASMRVKAASKSGTPAPRQLWSIPFVVGERRGQVQGVTQWISNLPATGMPSSVQAALSVPR